MMLRFTVAFRSFLFLTVHRPPCSSKPDFLWVFFISLEDISSSPSAFFILDDFNLHLDIPDDYYCSAFNSLLETFDLV